MQQHGDSECDDQRVACGDDRVRREPLLRGGDSECGADRDGRRDLHSRRRAEYQRSTGGQIDLVASTPGTYTVTYAFSSGGCNSTATASVTINALPVATIAYAGSPYCAVGTASVTQTGTAGGTYSTGAGLSINGGTAARLTWWRARLGHTR